MNVPFFDMKPILKDSDDMITQALVEVIDSGQFILGPQVRGFEGAVAEYAGTEYAVGVASGTDALILALKALGINRGDAVLTTAYSFIASASAIALIGAVPVFVDINPVTFNMDPEKIADALMWYGEKEGYEGFKGIVVTHLFGQCADMGGILKRAETWELKLIEDGAQSFGAYYKYSCKILNSLLYFL